MGTLRLWLLLGLAALNPATLAPGAERWAGWHFPLPAGVWLVSRGPCNSPAPHDHGCDWYEDRCAIDVIAADGQTLNTPVLAPAAGAVLSAGFRADAGNTLSIEHFDGRVSVLMHLNRLAVQAGQAVRLGQVVGYVGGTGWKSGGPHLHFHVLANAQTRACVSLDGLDRLDLAAQRLTSANLSRAELVLVNPPPGVFAWSARNSAPSPTSGLPFGRLRALAQYRPAPLPR